MFIDALFYHTKPLKTPSAKASESLLDLLPNPIKTPGLGLISLTLLLILSP